MKKPYHFFLVLIILFSCSPDLPQEVQSEYNQLDGVVSYSFDVKPILSDKCYHCHGPDSEVRKANLRLDTKEGLFKEGVEGIRAFVSGNVSKSEAIKRILSTEPEYVMPPVDSHRELSKKEIATLIKWVEQGAKWERHWSFIPPIKTSPLPSDWKTNNEIDDFIHEKLRDKGLEPSVDAEKERLLRRVTMDLTGLPPSISQQEQFMNDPSPNAYEQLVDRLLSSSAYAERMTLEWLDVARYADSHGFHADGLRKAWPWRDWVIQAFKENKPYNEFITEQLAGDLLPNPTRDQIIATAFNRNHPMTAEGGVVDEEFRVEYVLDRTNTVGTALMGLTLECSRCHDHKFDPISQKEYYQVSAFFNNVREVGMTGDDGDYGPMVLLSTDESESEKAYLEGKIDSLTRTKETLKTDSYRTISPSIHVRFEKVSQLEEDNYLDDQQNLAAQGKLDFIEGINDKAISFDSQYDKVFINDFGDFNSHEPFAISVWVNLQKETGKTKVIVGNAGEKNNLWRGWDFYLDSTNHLSFRLIHSLPHNMIHVKSKESVQLDKWNHLFVSYDGSMDSEGVELAINGKKAERIEVYNRLYKNILPIEVNRELSDRGLQVGQSYRAFTGDNGILNGYLDEMLIFENQVPVNEAAKIMEQSINTVKASASVPAGEKLNRIDKELKTARGEYLALMDTIPELMVMEEMSKPRSSFILNRGQYDQPTEEVLPGAVNEVLPFDSNRWPANRLGLAKWLFDEENPLTARVAVNRYWQMIFGQGLVATANDFGNQGSLPTHPELLDWLAVDLMESGWDVKALIKKMVMSATYQQSSTSTEKHMEKDPQNTWLARAPSYRWQAEFIRDNALAASGLLNSNVGGESVKPYQPEGLWIELGNFSYYLLTYKQDEGEKQYRRSMYTFIRRTSPPPFMTLFDAPPREVCTITRERTNTPLQALALLNDPQFVEAGRALATRVARMSLDSVDERIEAAFKLALSRVPDDDEVRILKDLYEEEKKLFMDNESDINEYLAVGDFEIPGELKNSDLAALSLVTNTILNMDEAYTKR